MPPTTTSISCTAVLMPSSTSALKSHTFLNLQVEEIYVSQRDDVKSILIGSLLCVLRQAISRTDGVPAILASIIGGCLRDIVVATSKVPAFDDDAQNPLYGYRTLGTLELIPVNFETPSFMFDPERELLAVHSVEDPKTERYFRFWRPCGIEVSTHFIIIFTNVGHPPLSTSRHSSPRSYSSPRGPFGNTITASRHSSVSFDDQHRTPSPLAINSTEANFSLFGFDDAASQPVLDSSASSNGILPAHFSNDTGSGISRPPSVSQYHPNTTIIDKIHNEHHIARDILEKAVFRRWDAKLFLDMVLNHRYMSQVLIALQLQECYGESCVASASVALDGRTWTAVEILKEFKWSFDSYNHKSTWYGWAENVARSFRWLEPVPTESA